MQENGAKSTVAMLFDRTHKRKGMGEFVDAKSKKVSVGSQFSIQAYLYVNIY